MNICAATLDDILQILYPVLLKQTSHLRASRGANSELLGVTLKLDSPRARLSRSETRGRPFSALGELLWYLTKDNRLDFIQPYIPAYERDSEDGLSVHGGYGPRLFAQRGHDQVANIVNLLRDFPTSRRAVIQIFNAEDNSRRFKEVPCTTTLQFFNRDQKLYLITTMRSNDAYLGLPHDFFCFTMLQEIIARILNLEIGTYRHFIGSLHLYETDRLNARRYLEEGIQRTVEMPPMPMGDPRPAIQHLFEAERLVRRRKSVDAGKLNLEPYWADLVRLIQIHFAQGDAARLSSLQAELVHNSYRTFVDGQLSKKSLKSVEPAQGSLPL